MTNLTARYLIEDGLRANAFMARTVSAHCLFIMDVYDAKALLPACMEENYFEAKALAAKTSYFESKNVLIADDNGNAEKSFGKWLALQKHDVRAVNSLHAWREAVNWKQSELLEDIDALEQVKNPAAKGYLDATIHRKEAEYLELSKLRHELDKAMDEVKQNRKEVAA